MAKFVLTAELNLQGPRNIGSIVNQINSQLKDIKIDVKLRNSTSAIRDINQIKDATNKTTDAANKMGAAFGVSLKRFAAFSIASRAIGLFSSKIAGAIDDAIEFQNQMVRLSQITGQTLTQLKGVSDQIGNLASSLGVASKDIVRVTDILAQAGLQARDLEVAINTLSKTALAPTFGKIEDTAEGAVAILAQFGEGVGALERQLGAINKVSAKFAVESEDLISVVRRTGGVFKASGGSLEELLAVFTSVRATTRESAESIATGLRTIFTRIQRPQTIEYLKTLGIELKDVEGKFVGPYEAVRRLSQGLQGLEEGDIRFIQISEELGGYRQIGKVIPLLRQFELAEKARQEAIAGGTSLDEDVKTAQQSLAVQFTKTRESFLKLIRDISDTTSFKVLVQTSLNFANSLIKVADALKPIIPLIAAIAAVKFTQNLGSFFAGVGAGFKRPVGPTGKNSGGRIHAFARGGLVPGSGNRDTVPAMLSPGEFVIRKSSVNKIGASKLAAMNENRYAKGGIIELGGSVSRTLIKDKNGNIYGLQQDKYSIPDTRFIGIELNTEKYNEITDKKLTNQKKGQLWENYLSKTQAKKVGKKQNFPGFPVDFINKGQLYDAKNYTNPSRLTLKEQAKKSLNYLLYETFGSNYKYTGAQQNTITTNGPPKLTNQTKKLTTGQDEIKLPPVPFLIPVKKKQFGGFIRRYATGTAGKGVDPLTSEERAEYESFGRVAGLLKFAGKTISKKRLDPRSTLFDRSEFNKALSAARLSKSQGQAAIAALPQYGAVFLKKGVALGNKLTDKAGREFGLKSLYMGADDSQNIQNTVVKNGAVDLINSVANYMLGAIGGGKAAGAMTTPNLAGITGSIFEAALRKIDDLPGDGDPDKLTFDFPSGLGANAAKIFGADAAMLAGLKTDAKFASTKDARESIRSKVARDLDAQMATARGKGQQVQKKFFGGIIQKFATGTSGRGVMPLIDDIVKNAAGAIAPKPDVAMRAIKSAGGYGALDVDRTLFRTKGDQAYGRAKTTGAQAAVLQRMFRDHQFRLKDVQTAEMTKFGKMLKKAIASGEIDPSKLFIISKSGNTPGLSEYINQVFGIPTSQMKFTEGGSKEGPLSAFRTKKAAGGSIASSDTVPALLTPGEFVINKSSAQRIGYGNLNRMNKQGVTGFARGGAVNVQKYANGTGSTGARSIGSDIFGNIGFQVTAVVGVLQSFTGAVDENSGVLAKLTDKFLGLVTTISVVTGVLQAFGVSLNIDKIKKFFGGGAGGFGDLVGGFRREKTISTRMPGESFREGYLIDFQAKNELQSERKKLKNRSSRSNDQLKAYRDIRSVSLSKFPNISQTLASGKYADTYTERKQEADRLRALRKRAESKSPTSLTGRAGEFLGRQTTAGGFRGAAARTAGGAITKIGESAFGKAATAFAGKLAAAAGPLTAVTTGALLLSDAVNTVIGSFYNWDKQLEQAVSAGDVEKAGEAARGKAGLASADFTRTLGAVIGGAVGVGVGSLFAGVGAVPGGAIGAGVGLAIGSAVAQFTEGVNIMFGGNTIDSAVALAEAQAQATKTSLALNKANESLSIAMEKAASGMDATEAFKDTFDQLKEVNALSGRTEKAIAENQKNRSEIGSGAILRNIGAYLGGGLFGMETAATRNTRLAEQDTQLAQAEAEALRKAAPIRQAAAIEYSKGFIFAQANAGQDAAKIFENTQQNLAKQGISSAALNERANDLTRRAKEAEANGNLKLASTLNESAIALKQDGEKLDIALKNQIKSIQATVSYFKELNSTRVDNVLANANAVSLSLDSIGGSASKLDASIAIIEASITSAGRALNSDQIAKAQQTLKNNLIKYGATAEQATKAVAKAQGYRDIQTILPEIFENIRQAGMKGSLKAGVPGLTDALEQQIQKSNLGKEAKDSLRTQIRQIKFEEDFNLTGIEGAFINLQKQIDSGAQDANSSLIDASKKISEASAKFIEVQKEAIEIQLESKKIAEEFGGPILTVADKFNALNAQLNIDLKNDAGSRKTILDYTRKRLDLIREEIEIAKKKNALEKSAFEKLLSGDIEGAIEDQAAAGAQKLLQLGDVGLARSLGSKALLGGLKNLQDIPGVSAEIKGVAARTAGLAVGASIQSAEAFADATPEIRALQAEGRQLAEQLSVTATQMQVEAQNVIINTAAGINQGAPGMAKGGMVYASAGRFIPRGTDTVPAMLTPGEFVVNARATKQNLSLLRAINGGVGAANSSSGVTYAATGGQASVISPETLEIFGNSVKSFADAVNKLQQTKLSVQLDTTNVNVNFTGMSFLADLTNNIKNSVIELVRTKLKDFRIDNDGILRDKNGSGL